MKLSHVILLSCIMSVCTLDVHGLIALTRNEVGASAATVALLVAPWALGLKDDSNALGVDPHSPGAIALGLLAAHLLKNKKGVDLSAIYPILFTGLVAGNRHLRKLPIFNGAPTARLTLVSGLAFAALYAAFREG